jgi:hypothetical protein
MPQILMAQAFMPAMVAHYVVQMRQYETFSMGVGVLWTERSGCMYVLHAVNVVGLKKAT